LAMVPANERPAIAIFYDGFNDAQHSYLFGAGALQRDLADKFAMLVEARSAEVAAYGMSAWLAQHSKSWAAFVHPRIQSRMFGAPPIAESADNAVAVYVKNVEMDDAICDLFHVRCFFILQPLVATKTPLATVER